MHLSFSALLCALTIRLAIAGHPIGQLVSDTSPAKPNHFSNVALLPRDERSASPTLISGLLVRQSRCPSGYGLCSNGFCCLLNSSCCSGDGCCRSGTYCYSTGCCNNGVTGCGTGCCPIGARCCPNGRCCYTGTHCCSGGGCCDDSEYCTVVDGQKGCCPLGKICTGRPPPASSTSHTPSQSTTRTPSPTSIATPPTHAPPTSSHAPPTSTSPDTALSSSTTPSLVPSSTSQNSTVSSSSTPTGGPSSGTNITVSATDSSIIFTGSWTIISATCSSLAPAKQCQGPGNSMSYTFTGSAIYLTIGQNSNSGVYSIDFDGVTVILDGYSSSTRACNVSWYRVDLAFTQHTIVINTVGVSSQAPSSSLGTFEFVNFIVSHQSGLSSTVEGSTHSSSSSISSTGSGSAQNGSPRAAESGMKFLFYASALVYFTLYWL